MAGGAARDVLEWLQWFKVTAWTRWAMLATCVVGIGYGFYYYVPQFAATPAALWVFVPDSPLAVTWAFLALALYGARGRRSDWLDALAFVSNAQVGLWTAYVLIAYWDAFGIYTFNLNFVLFWGHLGMVALGAVFARDLRASLARRPGRRPIVLGVVLAWLLVNDAVDYLAFRGYYHADCGLRPWTVPCDPGTEGVTAAVTFVLSAGSIATLAWLTRVPAGTRGRAFPGPG